MANDPNAAPASGDLDLQGLSTDISQINTSYDPQIQSERDSAQGYEKQAVEQSERAADQSAAAAKQLQYDEGQLQQWLSSTPTRQASYATAMHAAPILSILTALGGKMTRLNGMQMLSAQNGIISGLNESAEAKYQDAYTQWQNAYQRMKDHQAEQMKYYELMLGAYSGRADAYQKAAEAARRMSGDLLDQKQQALNNRVNLFKAQSEAMNRLDRIQLSLQSLHERVQKDMAQENHWKEMEKKTTGANDPRIKAMMQALHAKWGNLKAQVDAAYKQRGQINSNLDLPAEQKASLQAGIDEKVEALEMQMNSVVAEGDALLSTPNVNPEAVQPGGASAGAIPPGQGRVGAIARPPGAQAQATQQNSPGADQLPPQAKQSLQQHQGSPVKFANGQTWIMDAQGTVSRVQ